MRICIKILNFVLATILLTSAALHQEKADVFEFDLVLGVQTEEVGPGDYIECSPVVTNIGNIPGNVYLKIILLMVSSDTLQRPVSIREIKPQVLLILCAN